jgi:hypothetical protein
MSSSPNCRCDIFTHPALITNPPGRGIIRYRLGDYTSFRHALLLSLPGEIELLRWKPAAGSDLALQMVEWWAYLADILTFYSERIANEDYLDTASLDESVKRLIRLLGYRPRPGIGALATLAAISNAKKPFLLPQGFGVQSKPGPGKKPQIFELDADTTIQPLSLVSADPLPQPVTLGADGTVLLKGTVSIKKGEQLLVVERGWDGSDPNYSIANVVNVKPEKDPRGSTNTRVTFSGPLGLPSGASATGYRLMRSSQSTHLWQYNGEGSALTVDDTTGTAHLESVVRQIHPGDMILFDRSSGVEGVTTGSLVQPPRRTTGSGFSIGSEKFVSEVDRTEFRFAPILQLSSVTDYTEALWYANSLDDPPTTPPATPPNTPGIAVLHSQLTFTPAYSGLGSFSAVIRHSWQDAGQLIPTPATTFSGTPAELLAVKPPNFLAGSSSVLLEDAVGDGEGATGFVGADTTVMQLSNLPDNPPALASPINVLYNLLNVSRGKSVSNEILGSGDATIAGQEFVLKNSPLTYLLSGDSSAGGNYKSTLRVWVNGIEWHEAPSFFGAAKSATIFVTREDEDNKTHVLFGDGVSGARLPSGSNNVVARYRFGSGAEAPDAGKLTVIATPQPGLSAIHNPVPAGGGADPEPASQIRRYAPLSVLTFGRAVSGDDYEAIAALAPGVRRASASWSFDPVLQRTVVTVYVGDDASAKNAATVALRGDADPNRPVSVKLAAAVALQISLTLVVDPNRIAADVVAAVTQTLSDPQTGLFGNQRIGIGEVIYVSRIYAACFTVPGVIAVHHLQVHTGSFLFFTLISLVFSHSLGPHVIFAPQSPYRLDPGEGKYFSLSATALNISSEVSHA